MEYAQIILPLVGAALCAWAALQMSGWVKLKRPKMLGGDALKPKEKRNSNASQKAGSAEQQKQREATCDQGAWNGFRSFTVAAIEPEAENCHSVYLTPSDGKMIANFKPGQHLTLRLNLDGEAKPVIRCYSLSSSFHPSCYRISVKKVAAPLDPPQLPAGRVSSHINSELQIGQRIEIKMPSGSFYLDDQSDRPVVLMAGGIGITPMMSMIETLIDQKSTRGVLLFYGVNNRQQHIFGSRLKTIAHQHKNISIINCYSEPAAADRPNQDYQVRGRITPELIRKALPHNQFDFYLCGPPPFMESIYHALKEWDVPDDKIHFEAFGPATVKRVAANRASDDKPSEVAAIHHVRFSESNHETQWDSCKHQSILEAAESLGVVIDSGCRAGSCGTCETALLAGTVEYPGQEAVNCARGRCLPCVAVPTSDVELEV